MGLLTDPKSRERLVSVVSRHNNKLCVLCYAAGICWFLALAYHPFNAQTYFSENALLPGLVESHFHHDFGAADFLKSFKDEMRRIKEVGDKERMLQVPTSWLESQMMSLGLDVFTQNFSYVYPAGILRSQLFHGENVYGILRAPRAASTEALVLSVPYRSPEAPEAEKTHPGIALMLALAKAFRRHSYWAKDVIFLVTGHETVGMQAWLNAYHHTPHPFIVPGELHGRSGAIQAAINLEIASDAISKFSIKMEGLNGQLPNLDLVNTVVRLCKRERVQPTLHKTSDPRQPESWAGFQQSLETMGRMMVQQATGAPSGNHGLFHRFNIEAVTILGVKVKGVRHGVSFTDMGRVLEGVFRSLNNLLERFHQSFFFYLLPATERYVSIGLYMPPFGIMAIPIIIKKIPRKTGTTDNDVTLLVVMLPRVLAVSKSLAVLQYTLALWIHYTYTDDEEDKKEKDEKELGELKKTLETAAEAKKDTKEKDAGKKGKSTEKKEDSKKKEEEPEEKKDKPSPRGRAEVMLILPWLVMALVFGLACNYGPGFVIQTSQPFRMPPGEGLSWGALALMFSAMIFPRLLQRKARQKGDTHGPNPYLLKCLGLLALGLILGALSVINISMAFFITAVWTPILLVIWPRTSRILTGIQYLILLSVSPLGLVFFGNMARHALLQVVKDPMALLAESWASTQAALLYGVVDGHLIGSWTYNIVALAVFPVWLMFWSLQYADVNV